MSRTYVGLVSPKPGTYAQFGYSISVSGDGSTLAIGSPGFPDVSMAS